MRRYLTLLLTLSAIWGASYLLIKVGVRDFDPAALVELRLLFAAPIVVGFLVWRIGRRAAAGEIRAIGWRGLVLGSVGMAIPFSSSAGARRASTPESQRSRTRPCRSSTSCS